MKELSEFSLLIADEKELAQVVARWRSFLEKAQVVSLEGELGVGKTHFVKAFVGMLGGEEPVTSPTFSLLQTYQTPAREVHHLDWYRLEQEEEVFHLGLEDYYATGITFIEWGNKFPHLLPAGTAKVLFEIPTGKTPEESSTSRQLTLLMASSFSSLS